MCMRRSDTSDRLRRVASLAGRDARDACDASAAVHLPLDAALRRDEARPGLKRSFPDKEEWRSVLASLEQAGKLTYFRYSDTVQLPPAAPPPPAE